MEKLSEIKEIFYREHVRDRRLTLINYVLILSIIVLIVAGLAYIGVDFKKLITDLVGYTENTDGSMTSLYPIIAAVVGFFFVLAYPFYLLWKISKRPKKIEELVEKAGKGARLSYINDYVEYKITIPLLKINLKICPVTYLQIFLDKELKPYVLPFRNAYIPDLKIVLSGENLDEINKHKDELYGEVSNASDEAIENTNIVATLLKTEAEFKTFLEAELKSDITALESSRSSMRKTMVVGGIIAGIVVVGVMGYVFYNAFSGGVSTGEFNPMTSIVPIFASGIVIAIFFNMMMKKKHAKTESTVAETITFGGNSFKEKIVTKMIHFVNPSVKYIPMAHLALGDIFESGLFQERNYTVGGSDQISGKHNGVPFIMCDLSLYFKRNFSDEKESPDCAFFGQFFVARFNKHFSMPVYIIPKKRKYDIGSYLTGDKGEAVKLEDPEFMKIYDVYSKDQVEARYILTPSLMERIKELAKRTKGEYHIAFYNNKITVANNSGINNFEVGYAKSLTDKDNALLIGFYNDLCNQFALVDELKLNVNIWKKL